MNRRLKERQTAMMEVLTNKVGGILCIVVGVVMLASIATVPLTVGQLVAVGISTAVLFLIANRFSDRRVTLFLSVLSLAMSARYIYWRATSNLTFHTNDT